MSDELDRRPWLHQRYDHEGPSWREAIDYGIDVSLLEANLELTIEQRLQQLQSMTELYEALRPKAREDDHSPEQP